MLFGLEHMPVDLVHDIDVLMTPKSLETTSMGRRLHNRETGRNDTQSWTFHALMLPTPRQIIMLEKRNLMVDPQALENPLFAFLTNLSDPESHGHQAHMIEPDV